jgi:signal peptidase II
MGMGPRIFSTLVPVIALVGCDHATKWSAKERLEGAHPQELLGSALDLRYVENSDVAFNLLRWVHEGIRTPLLLGVGALAVAVLFALVLRGGPTGSVRAAWVLILGGALGNLSDRLLRGVVVDFIHVAHWPVFNVADVAVTLGILLLGWATLGPSRQRGAPERGS